MFIKKLWIHSFKDGDTVLITTDKIEEGTNTKYPLLGTIKKYDNPIEPAFPPEERDIINDPD
ncbi:MAG: hypothetical protein JST15_11275 [Bacteroidetes bacterium]|nr:hypothetical protein [Bacteroidota bacterium]